ELLKVSAQLQNVAVAVKCSRPFKWQKILDIMLRNCNLFLNHLFFGWDVVHADIKEGEVVVDIGSGGGIDVFLSANKVKDSGKVIGIDMTDQMLASFEARKNANQGAYTNVEFRKGDIEKRIRVEDSAVDVATNIVVIRFKIYTSICNGICG
ncbi:MAG: methyltransferase domain-containing protein, partial [Candidatus Nitrosopolaris sp.]